MVAIATAPNTATSGRVAVSSAKIEPNRIVTVAPVVLCEVVPRYRNRAASPNPAPSTIPVARSRPRARWIPISSMIPAAATEIPTNPHSGAIPTRYALDPPVAPMSPSASPANDWPRITVNTPTQPATIATSAPTTSASWTELEEKNPGAMIAARTRRQTMA